MTKNDFVFALLEKLSGFPEEEVKEGIRFYLESIEDRIEEGVLEEEAVEAVGSIDTIAAQIMEDIPVSKIAMNNLKSRRRLKVWEIVLLVLGSPVWLSLLIATFAIVLSLYISLWAIIISLWAVLVSLAACAFACAVIGIGFLIEGYGAAAMAYFGAGVVCAGLSILIFLGCKAATKGMIQLTEKTSVRIKKRFARAKEEM